MSKSLSRTSSISSSDFYEFTPLQEAAVKGNLEEVKYLLSSEVDVDIGPNTALHLALRKRHVDVAVHLLQVGADFESRDCNEDCPIHIACSLGLLNVVHMLCSLGCRVEVPNAAGLFPLHLAARNGHINVVRCLCVAGCNLDVRNYDNIRADITALKYGHNDIAELFDKLRATGQRDCLSRQLVPTSKSAAKVLIRVLGNCGVGKTALIKSLGAGLFSSLFRKSSSLQSNKSRPSSPVNTQIEMDVTSRQNSLTFECAANYESTKGIHVQNLDIINVGEATAFEFSGQENYFPIYHHFLRPNWQTLTLILFSLEDSMVTQIKQVCFWINFLLAREASDVSTSDFGQILLVATHVDTTRAVKTQNGEWISHDAQNVLETVENLIPHVLNLHSNVIVMDCNVPASYGFKQIKSLLNTLKQESIEKTIGSWTGLLDSTLSWLINLRKDYEQFPVLYTEIFYNLLRSQVNLLALDENIAELLQQLCIRGEVFYIQNLVIISLPWLGSNLIGELLSNEFLANVRPTGVYTSDDFQAYFNYCDALGTLELLEAFGLCIPCEVEGDVEYEFPIYNQTETLPGLWDSGDPRYRTTGACYGGIRLHAPSQNFHMFSSIFAHIQVELRRATINSNNDNDTDLYQWHLGSKLCTITLETLITLNEGDNNMQFVEIKIRGPRQSSQYCFYFFENVVEIVVEAVAQICPGLVLEKHILSPQQLRIHLEDIHCYSSESITLAMIEGESTLEISFKNAITEKQESITQLLLFDDVELATNIQWGCALQVSHLMNSTKLKLGRMLDPPDSHGKDWCLLALKLGLEPEIIAALDSEYSSYTIKLLDVTKCTVGAFIATLHELGRSDVAEVVLRSAPVYKIIEPVEAGSNLL